MSRRKPNAGESVRVLPDYGDTYEAVVVDLLATQFTARLADAGDGIERTVFLFYDPMKGHDWEFTNE